MTNGSVEPLKKLYARFGDQVHFIDVVVRQAHPGPREPAYHSVEQKMEDARRYRREEQIPWPVVVDDLAGTTHQVYGSMADPTYLIGTDGRVSLYNQWTHAPTLHEGLEALLAQGGRGAVKGGFDSQVHLLAAFADGWRGIARGLPQSAEDLHRAAPGSVVLLQLGYRLRPLFAPIALRGEPLPAAAKLALALGGLGLTALAARALFGRARS